MQMEKIWRAFLAGNDSLERGGCSCFFYTIILLGCLPLIAVSTTEVSLSERVAAVLDEATVIATMFCEL